MRGLYRFVWRATASRQIVLIGLAIAAAVLAVAPLELQRHIVNTLAGRETPDRLAWLCGAYLIAALGLGGLKYLLNIKSAGLGEATIRSLREEIAGKPPPLIPGPAGDQGKDKPGTLVAMIAAEAEAVGKFVGDCISTPLVQAGTLFSVLAYMLYTEPRLGLVVLLIAVPQLVVVPIVQRRINRRVRERVVTLRRAGDLVVADPQSGNRPPSGPRKGEIAEAFAAIYHVRLQVFRLKYGLKFLTSGMQSIGVFALLFVGGLMVLHGETEIGIVVAFISGLDRVLDPWRELIAFVRSTSAAKVQFDLIESTLGRQL